MGITHISGLAVAGVPTMGMNGLPLTTGNVFFCDYVNGNDANTGSADSPMKTVYVAYAACRDGYNDTVVIVGNGQASGTQRLSVANAQVATPAATTGTLTWAKNACHLVGIGSPTQNSRARLAPPTGTYTQTTFGSGNLVVVTGQGCIFSNLSTFHAFSTGGNNQICWTDSTNGRNYYYNVSFGGAADTASAQSTSSRSLLITGGGESYFERCWIGLDTVTKTVANASLEFAGNTPRNYFKQCVFPIYTSSATTVFIKVAAGPGTMDRWQVFDECTFENAILSASTGMTGVAILGASTGGGLLMRKSTMVGATDWGYDATSKAQIYVDGAVPTGNSSGISVVNT